MRRGRPRSVSGELIRRSKELKKEVRPRPDLVRPLEEVVREHVESALILCVGNRKLAATRLRISYTGIRNWVEKFRQEDLAATADRD
jgi:hypothetical protein